MVFSLEIPVENPLSSRYSSKRKHSFLKILPEKKMIFCLDIPLEESTLFCIIDTPLKKILFSQNIPPSTQILPPNIHLEVNILFSQRRKLFSPHSSLEDNTEN
jgi:hypothetical protein